VSEPRPKLTYRELTTIRWVPLGEAIALQGVIEAMGFFAFGSDTTMKAMDPFAIGGNAFAVAVQVPAEDAAEIEQLLASSNWESQRYEIDGPAAAPASRSRRYEVIETLGRRIRFASALAFYVPFFPAAATRYFLAARRLRPRPRNYFLTLASAITAL
jgi:hypothetical protein